MPKTKNILVASILTVYFGLIGANLVWQYGDDVFGIALQADSLSEADLELSENMAAIKADLEEKNANTLNALKKSQDEALNNKATQAARSAQESLASEFTTDLQQYTKYQGTSYAAKLAKQNPDIFSAAAAIGPKYKDLADKAKRLKKQSDVYISMAAAAKTKLDAQKAKIARLLAIVSFAQKHGIPLSSKTVAEAQQLQKGAAEDCLATAKSLSDEKVNREKAKEQAAAAAPGWISGETINICTGEEELAEGEECIDGVTPEGIGYDYEKAENPLSAPPTVDGAVANEYKRQAQIETTCAELTAAQNSIGENDYAALNANLNNLSTALDTTSKRNQGAINSAKVAVADDIKNQNYAANKEMQQKNEAAVATQLANNKAAADAASAEESGPSPIPIGFSNTGLDGEKILPDFEGDVIPISPTFFDGKVLMPSWDYSYGDGLGSMNSPGMSNADLGYPQ